MDHTELPASTPPAPPAAARALIGRWLAAGTLASLFSTVVLAWHGRRRHGSTTALINSPSHWVHGDRALRANAFSLRFTLLGGLIHHFSSMFWAVLYEAFLSSRRKRAADNDSEAPRTPSTSEVIAAASALTAVAWLVDTRLVPSRLTPGFERRSSAAGMLFIYGSFAAGLAAGALWMQRKKPSETPATARLYPMRRTGSV